MVMAPLLKIMAIKWSIIIGMNILARRMNAPTIKTGQFTKIPKGFW